jgi:hypothetical protein
MQRRLLAALLGTLFASNVLAQSSACFDLNIGTDLGLGDDATSPGLSLGFTFNFAGVAYTQICVCSNGYIWLGPTSVTGGDYSPTEAELRTGAPRICPLWLDFQADATGSGHIYYNTVAASGSNPAYATVTWAGVFEYGTTNALSFQIKLDANNAINVSYGPDCANATGGTFSPGTAIIGASPGNGAASNLVSFASRPFNITSNTFADVQALPGFAYAGASMNWSSLNPSPGYAVADNVCTPVAYASYNRIGNGCPSPVSVYEMFNYATHAMDLSNLSFAFLANGSGGYVMVQPGSSWFSGYSSNINAGDDTTTSVTLPFAFPHAGGVLNSIVVSSNGFIWLDPSNLAVEYAPSVAGLLGESPRIAGMWTDLNAGAGGAVYADLDSNTGQFVITWAGVPEYNVGGSNTFQIALDAGGGFELRYQTVGLVPGPTGYHSAIAGYSGGNPALDSPIDLSATSLHDTGAAGTPLDMSPTGNPTPQLGTTFTLTTSSIPATSALAITILGNLPSNPALDLTSLGAPGCFGHVNVFSGLVIPVFQLTGGSGSVAVSLPIPTTLSLCGVTLYAQGAATTSGNALGLIFSNGGRLFVGL